MKKIIFLCLIVFLVQISVFTFEKEYGPEKSKNRILLAYEKTTFKERLIGALVKSLNDEKTYIKIVEHTKNQKNNELNNEDPTQYTAVFITNSGVGSRIRPWLLAWLKKYEKNNKNIILHTTIEKDWQPKIDVDSITSASFVTKIKELVKEITDKIKKITVS